MQCKTGMILFQSLASVTNSSIQQMMLSIDVQRLSRKCKKFHRDMVSIEKQYNNIFITTLLHPCVNLMAVFTENINQKPDHTCQHCTKAFEINVNVVCSNCHMQGNILISVTCNSI